ncbi:hypothetical protein [Flexivirga oryzae]|uniref:GTPase-associated protein 1 N-terminal domain-containing protein n=1 Tax=Flexivirga oryzae TaxID=1794944 RepID=A0A839N4Z1_9MICO|nr:hypothetical protein [Flexivirga oryzae]MBB2891134.1 hypothetical protein [Flexivirga oryzae]
MIDQLRYAWAKRGLVGVGRLQPVAASPGLLNSQTKKHTLALRLCEYTKPAGASTTPVSYGWLDSGASRFLFRREFLADDQAGHPGNFAAHVLVGPIAELSVARCLALYRGRFWWHGPKSDNALGELPELDVNQLLTEIAGTDPHDAKGAVTRDLLTQLLAQGSAARLNGSPDELVAAMRVVDRMLPGLLDARSFSTYEAGQLARFFTIHGPGPAGSTRSQPSAACAEAKTAATTLLSNSQLRSTMATTMWMGLSGPEDTRVKAFRRTVCAVSAGLQGSTTDVAAVLPALRTPECAGQLFEFTQIRDAVAGALVRGGSGDVSRDQIVTSLLASQDAIHHDMWDAFDRAVLDALGDAVPERELCTALDRLPHSDSLFLIATTLLGHANDEGSPTRNWPALLLLAALNKPAELPNRDYAHAIETVAPDLRLWVRRPELARRQQVDLLASHTRTGRVPPVGDIRTLEPAFRQLVLSDPAALAPVAPRLFTDPYVGDIVRDQIVRSAATSGTLPAAHLELLQSVLGNRNPSAEDLDAIAVLSTGVRLPEVWGQFVTDLASQHGSHVLQDPDAPHMTDLRRLIRGAGDVPIGALMPVIDVPRSAETIERSLQSLPSGQARIWRQLYVDREICLKSPSSRRLAVLMEVISRIEGKDAAAERILIAAHRATKVYRQSLVCYYALTTLAEYFPNGFAHGRGIREIARRPSIQRYRLRDLATRDFALLTDSNRQYADSVVHYFSDQSPNDAWLELLTGRTGRSLRPPWGGKSTREIERRGSPRRH